MLKPERHAYILHQVDLHNRVLSSHLSEQMQVSEDTIRRDLAELAQMEKILKVHGGALSKSFHQGIKNKDVYARDYKRTIAQKAISLIQDGMFVLTGGGTTIIEFAKLLPQHIQATFITGSIPAAMQYITHPNLHVIMLGGKVSRNAQMTFGASVISTIGNIKADLCLMGINAIDPINGLTDNDWEVVELKRSMIEASKKTVALSISEKVNCAEQLKICPIEKIDMLITELEPSDPLLETYRQKGVTIL